MARTVFKIAEVVARRLVGSIPTRSRHLFDPALFYAGLRGDGVFHYTAYNTEIARAQLKFGAVRFGRFRFVCQPMCDQSKRRNECEACGAFGYSNESEAAGGRLRGS